MYILQNISFCVPEKEVRHLQYESEENNDRILIIGRAVTLKECMWHAVCMWEEINSKEEFNVVPECFVP